MLFDKVHTAKNAWAQHVERVSRRDELRGIWAYLCSKLINY